MPAAAEVLHHLAAAGVRLEVQGDALHASPREALTDETRALIRSNKPALLEILSGTAPSPAGDQAPDTATSYRYLIHHPDGTLASHSFTPPATMAEVRGWYPGALSIEVEPAPELAAASLEPDAHHLEVPA